MLQKSAKKVFNGELQEGKRSQGNQKKRYKGTFKASFKDFNIRTYSGNRLHRIKLSGVDSLPIESWTICFKVNL